VLRDKRLSGVFVRAPLAEVLSNYKILLLLPLLEHGKTTTSQYFRTYFTGGADVTAFIGGIVENYNSNLIGSGKTVTVVEADE
jgi:UDP-N-acetylmuramate-alanine ligase